MRLASLKVAGFKSFADPLTLHFPDALTAIVGPNGCGKSNVMDAIRWVMGESSARQLRGEAMSDVIFAGAGGRAAIGQASVELVFANTQGRLGGEYSAYTELSVRRVVTREGGSNYFLNGRRCRRRDIQDIFLGTGLGPRSYAVIQQGMINRIIEARPDELRVFIEEAAGVSRYHARRHETLHHLEQARQNLARLDDVRASQDSQMRQLRKQSQAAVRYRELQDEQQRLQAACWLAQWQTLKRRLGQQLALLHQQGEALVDLHEQREHWRAALEQASTQLEQLLRDSAPAQANWQQLEQQALAAELEQRQHLAQHDAIHAQRATLTQQQTAHHQTLKQQTTEHAALMATMAQLQANQPDESTLQAQAKQQQDQQQQLEAERNRLAQQAQQLATAQQAEHHLRQQIDQAQRSLERLGQQQQVLQHQRHVLEQAQCDDEHDHVQHEQRALNQQADALHTALADLEKSLDAQQSEHRHHQHQVRSLQQQQHERLLEQQALKQLMAREQPLSPNSLGQQLTLHADAPDQLAVWLDRMFAPWWRLEGEPAPGEPMPEAVSTGRWHLHAPPPQPVKWPAGVQPLARWITRPQLSLWQAIGVCTDPIDDAQLHTWRDALPVGCSLLHGPAGKIPLWCGRDWEQPLPARSDVQQKSANNPAAAGVFLPEGLLAQRLRLQALHEHVQTLAADLAQSQQAAQAAAQAVTALQAKQRDTEIKRRSTAQALHQLALQQSRLDTQRHMQAQQRQQLQDQMQVLETQRQALSLECDELQFSLASQTLQSERLQQRHAQEQADFAPRWDAAQRAMNALEATLRQQQHNRAQCQQAQARLQWLAQDMARTTASLAATTQALDALDDQQQTWAAAHDQVQAHATQQRLAADAARVMVACAQQQLDDTRQQLADSRVQLDRLMQTEQAHRQHMETHKLNWQADHTRLEQLEAHMAAAGVDRPANADSHPTQPPQEDGDVAPLEHALAAINSQLARMGDLNLAAPTALAALEQAHAELLAQQADVQASMAQLVQAIARIDQETRQRFMATFTAINEGLQRLFPQVFGGGEAQLALEDDWQSGVRLMARPPGKRNSSLALLSGGEKALTALALVFAIFKLNPAPFCLLDEVDAPLDDANVQRFCQLVTELSQDVQFIYISHNKLAMRMAQQLIGVTMPEAGVSCTVRVNLEQALHWGAQHTE